MVERRSPGNDRSVVSAPPDGADSATGADDAVPDADDSDASDDGVADTFVDAGDGADSGDAGDVAAVTDDDGVVVADPVDDGVEGIDHVVVVGYDAWTDPVLAELAGHDVSFTVVTTDAAAGERLEARGIATVESEDVDEACFRDAGIDRADAVLVATLDDQLNVLAVLTVMNVDESMRVVTFAGERQDVSKLRAAGADRVVSLGQAVGELLVEVALSERDVGDVVADLVGSRS